MLTTIRKPIFLTIIVCILSSLLTVKAADKIYSQHQEALDALKAEDWNNLNRLSAEALSVIDKELVNDWEYDGDLRIIDNQFLGDKLLLLSIQIKGEKRTPVIEIFDPLSGKREKKFKYKDYQPVNWYEPSSIGEGIVFVNLKESEGGKKRLIVLRENLITKPIEFKLECEELKVLSQNEDQLFVAAIQENPKIYSLNLTSGKHTEITASDALKLSEFDLFKINGKVMLIDGNNLYVYNPDNTNFSRRYTLPIEYSEKDKFQTPYLFSVRSDTVFKTDLSSTRLSFSTTIMPFKVDVEDCQSPKIYGDSKWFAQVRADSLYILDISSSVATLTGTYLFAGLDLSVKGEYLINTGENGMRVFHEGEQTYSMLGKPIKRSFQATTAGAWPSPISFNGFGKKTSPVAVEDTIYFFHQQPKDLVAFDLRNNRAIWTQKYFTLETEGRILDIEDEYIWVDGADGSKYLIDAATGNPLSIDRNRWGLEPPRFNSDSTLFTRWANWEVQYFRVCRLSEDRYLRGDFAGMISISAFNSGDTKKALQFGKTALASGLIQSEEVLDGLYNIFDKLGEVEAADRIAGQAYTTTGKETWKNRLAKSGMVIATDPFMVDSYSYYVTGDHLTTFTDWGQEEYAYRNRKINFNTIPLDGSEMSVKQLGIHSAYHIRTSEGPIAFVYSREDDSNRVSWNPLLIKNNGDIKYLSSLPDTYFAEGFLPDRRSRIHWWIPSGTSPGKDGYVLGDFLLWGMDGENSEYTFGADVKGNGPTWVDENLNEPVKAGEHFYAHRTYGNCILKVDEGTQADSLKLREGDIVIGMGDHWINTNLGINDIKKLYEPGELLNLYVIRDGDTLTYQIHNGRIGYNQNNAIAVVEVDPTTGKNLAVHPIDPEYHYACRTTEGYLIYQNGEKLLLFDPAKNIRKVSKVKGLDEFYMGASKSRLKNFWSPLETDKIILHGDRGRFIGIDLTFDTPDKKRILWDKVIENLHDCPFTDDPLVIPFILKNNEILYVEQATGDILFRETLPFETVWDSVVRDGVMYLSVEGRIVGWKLKYYQQ